MMKIISKVFSFLLISDFAFCQLPVKWLLNAGLTSSNQSLHSNTNKKVELFFSGYPAINIAFKEENTQYCGNNFVMAH